MSYIVKHIGSALPWLPCVKALCLVGDELGSAAMQQLSSAGHLKQSDLQLAESVLFSTSNPHGPHLQVVSFTGYVGQHLVPRAQ